MAQTYHKIRHYQAPENARDDVVYDSDDSTVVADANPAITKAQMVIQFIAGVILSLLAVRFLFVLFGANQANALVGIIYDVTAPLVEPFRGLFNVSNTAGTARLEYETLIAAVVYLLVAAGTIRLLDIFRR